MPSASWDERVMDGERHDAHAAGSVPDEPACRGTFDATTQHLYEYQEFNFVGPYGDHGFVEDYTSVVRGEPIGRVVVVSCPAAGRCGWRRS